MSRNAPSVDHYMHRFPHTIDADESLEAAHKLMRTYQIRHLPVMSDGDLVGLLSQRDLLLIETLKDVVPSRVPVRDAMARKPFVTAPSDPIDKVAAEMAANRIGSAVVVEEGEVIGIFTTVDALIALLHVWKTVP